MLLEFTEIFVMSFQNCTVFGLRWSIVYYDFRLSKAESMLSYWWSEQKTYFAIENSSSAIDYSGIIKVRIGLLKFFS